MRLPKVLLLLNFFAAVTFGITAQEFAEPEVADDVDKSRKTEDSTLTSTSTDRAGADEPYHVETTKEETSSLKDATADVLVEMPVQNGPFVDLFGPTLLSLEMTSPTTAQLNEMLTNDALRGKKVVGLYFSADWCGPCRQFTPELVSFYEKMNKRRGKKDEFEIVWISRCRDIQSYGKYFTEMNWIALPPQEAMGQRGQWLGEKYGVKSIPTLVLLDDVGNVITKDARNQIPKDKAGIGFPWRNPLATLYITILPKTLRHIIKSQLSSVKELVIKRIRAVMRPRQRTTS